MKVKERFVLNKMLCCVILLMWGAWMEASEFANQAVAPQGIGTQEGVVETVSKSARERSQITQETSNFASLRIDEIPKEGEIIINKEGYKFTEVLFIPWGDGEDEITIGSEGEYKYGPQCFVVDDQGNIYIDDPGKYQGYGTGRIIKYSQQERKLNYLKGISSIAGILDNGNILDMQGFVYSPEGKLLYKIRVPLMPDGIVRAFEYKDSIYINPSNEGYYILVVSDKEDKFGYKKAKFKGGRIGGWISNSKGESVYIKDKYPARNRGYPSRFSDRSYLISESSGNIEITYLDKSGKKRKKIMIKKEEKISEYKEVSNPSIVGEDKEGNIYCLMGLTIPSPYYPKKGFVSIQKYNEKGEVLLVLRKFSDWMGIDMTVLTYPFFIDDKGDIYQLYAQENGIRVVKWGR